MSLLAKQRGRGGISEICAFGPLSNIDSCLITLGNAELRFQLDPLRISIDDQMTANSLIVDPTRRLLGHQAIEGRPAIHLLLVFLVHFYI